MTTAPAPRTTKRARTLAGALLALLGAACALLLVADPVGFFADATAPEASAPPARASGADEAVAQSDEPTPPHAPPVDRVQVTALAAEDERWTFRGWVADSKDNGVGGARVTVWAMLAGEEHSDARVPIGAGVTTADGSFAVRFDTLRSFPELAQPDTVLHAVADAEGYYLGTADLEVETIRYRADRGDPFVLVVRVQAGRFLKGRVVTQDGQPVVGANVIGMCPEIAIWSESEIDGSFELDLSDAPADATSVTVVTADYRYGHATPVTVELRETVELRCPDLVIRPIGQGIEGVVRWPDGRPAAGVDVEVEFALADGAPDVALVGDQPVPEYHDLVNPDSNGSIDLWTDARGRFALDALRAGTYHVTIDERDPVPLRVEAGQTTKAEYVFGTHAEEHVAQLYVDVVDHEGHRLSFANYGCRMWRGKAAQIAAARYAQGGPTLELLATAEDSDFGNEGAWPTIAVQPGTFCVVEASYENAGPTYASAMLRPGQHRADVRLVLRPRRDTGDLRIVARAANGERIPKLWVRFVRGRDDAAVPVHAPGLQKKGFRLGDLRGRWLVLPEDGTVRGLPAGELLVDIMFAPTGAWDGGLSEHPTLLRRLHVRTGQTETLEVQVPVGAPIAIRLDGATRSRPHQEAWLYRVHENGDLERFEAMLPGPDQRGHDPREVMIYTRLGYPPGRYRLSLETYRYRRGAPREVEFEYDHRIGAGPAVVDVRPRKD